MFEFGIHHIKTTPYHLETDRNYMWQTPNFRAPVTANGHGGHPMDKQKI